MGKIITEDRKMLRVRRAVLALPLLLCAAVGFSQAGVEKQTIRWSRGSSVNEYLASHEGAKYPAREVVIKAVNYTNSEDAEVSVLADYKGRSNVLSWTGERGSVSWDFSIEESGFYIIAMDYSALPSKGMNIEFDVKVDGVNPYDDFMSVRFSRIWKDAYDIRQDENGNDLVPDQEEIYEWQTAAFLDTQGFYNKDLPVYLEAGDHVLTLELMREALVIDTIRIFNDTAAPDYADVAAGYNTANNPENIVVKVQGEKSSRKSDSTLVPTSDRSDAATEPASPSKIRLNTSGGNSTWKLPGQWIEWQFDVPEDGYYNIYVKGRQNSQRGMAATRKVYIDGVVPFSELENFEFDYSLHWQQFTPRDRDGTPCLIHLTKGTHTIRMEASLGRLTPILTAVDDLTYELNTLRRRFIMIMGSEPDLYRDYNLDKEIPGLITKLKELSVRFEEAANNFERITGQTGSEAATLRIMVDQLASFADEPEYIPNKQTSFRDNIANLATWILQRKELPVEIDYITIQTPDERPQRPTAGFFKGTWMNIRSFFASFFEDYDSIGKQQKDAVTVWIQSGRDQANILRQLIINDFTPKTGIDINLSLVQGSIVEATMAGRGPEIAINVARGQPVNLASRNALYDLTKFDDFDTVRPWFNDTAFIPYTFQDGIYAIPMTQDFHMMFYRTDIFEELGLDPPQTWDEMYAIIPVLQRNNMQIGLPYQSTDAIDLIDAGMGSRNLFPTLLLQNGGTFYKDNNTKTALTDPESYRAFKEWVDFYAAYGFTLKYDFNTRFRSGEMPLGITSYSMYNMLSVAAPEIRNEWEMTVIPGTMNENGEIDRSEAASGTACVMFNKIKNPEDGWEFLKWWMSPDIQLRYATQLETIMGTSARLNTANLETFDRMPWSLSEQEILKAQWANVREVQEVPGGYYTIRMLDTAFTKAYYDNENPRATLNKYCDMIDEEIQRKRKELGLDG